MIRAIATRILCQILLVIVGAEAESCMETSRLLRRAHLTGRLSVDVDVISPVDQSSGVADCRLDRYLPGANMKVAFELAFSIPLRSFVNSHKKTGYRIRGGD
jgi:hypothetical protein